MSPAQTNLYWRRWSACKRALAKLGRPADDAARHALHRQALGAEKSSKDFTNAEFDRVLAVFASFSAPADLKEQLRLQEQAAERGTALRAQIRELCAWCGVQMGREGSYLDAIARSTFRVQGYGQLDEKQLGVVRGILERRRAQLDRKAASYGKSAPGELAQAAEEKLERDDPF